MFWFIVLLLILGAGFYVYQKLMAIEREIRAEQEAEQTGSDVIEAETEDEMTEELSDPPVVTPEVESMAAKAKPVPDGKLDLDEEILIAVKNMPGMKQTELYSSFADVNRKRLQQLLKEMDDAGQIKREKQGSSYLLFPV